MRFIEEPDYYTRLITALRLRIFGNQYQSAPEHSPERPKSRSAEYPSPDYHTEIYEGNSSLSETVYGQEHHQEEQGISSSFSGALPTEHVPKVYDHEITDAELIDMAIEAVKNGEMSFGDILSALDSDVNVDHTEFTSDDLIAEASHDLWDEATDAAIDMADEFHGAFQEPLVGQLEQSYDEAGFASDGMNTGKSLEELVQYAAGETFAGPSLESIVNNAEFPVDDPMEDYAPEDPAEPELEHMTDGEPEDMDDPMMDPHMRHGGFPFYPGG